MLHEELLEPRLPLLEVLLHEGEDIRGRHRKGRGLTHYAPIGVSGLHLAAGRHEFNGKIHRMWLVVSMSQRAGREWASPPRAES